MVSNTPQKFYSNFDNEKISKTQKKLNSHDKKLLLIKKKLLQEGRCFSSRILDRFSSLSLKIMYASALNLSEWNFKDFSQFYSRNVVMSILVRIRSRF